MLGSIQRRPSSSGGDTEYRAALARLATRVAEVRANLVHTKNALQLEYHKDALEDLTRYFESISAQFVRYTQEQKGQYYWILVRSSGRMQAARRVAQTTLVVAKLFERYTRRPRSYSRTESGHKIEAVLAALSDLESYCTPSVD